MASLSRGDAAPKSTISVGLDVPNSLAFDSSGDLWVANFGDRTVVEYPRQQLSGGPVVPALTISSGPSGSLNSPAGMAFDASGDLWVANDLSNTLVEYSKTSLTYGPVVPDVTITSDGSKSLSGPYALAFDSAGDLWVANYDSSTLVDYPKNRLASGAQVPAVTISSDSSGSLNSPAGLAFDASGDLWVAANLSNKVLEYTRGELSSGHPRPAVTISADTRGSLNSPEGLTLDPGGDLWVANYGDNSLSEFAPSELSRSGSWSPSFIAGPDTGLRSPGYIAIGPPPSATAATTPSASASLLQLLTKAGLARVEIRCKTARCSGSIEIIGKLAEAKHGDRGAPKDRARLLGSAAYSLSQGGTRKFDVHLGKNADALLAELRDAPARSATGCNGAGRKDDQPYLLVTWKGFFWRHPGPRPCFLAPHGQGGGIMRSWPSWLAIHGDLAPRSSE